MFVGRILSRWESIEFELSRLYSCFAGAPDEQGPVAEYGKGNIFRDRAEILAAGADAYFRRNCNQNRESDFEALLMQVTGYVARRNDIAHGILFRIDNLSFFRREIEEDQQHRPHYAIIPPLYALRWHKTGLPDFAYTSVEMLQILRRLERVYLTVENFRHSILATRRY